MVAHTFNSSTRKVPWLQYTILHDPCLSKCEEHKMESYSYKSMHPTPDSSYIFTKYNVWDTCNVTAQVFQDAILEVLLQTCSLYI